jgi:hypothetical protein
MIASLLLFACSSEPTGAIPAQNHNPIGEEVVGAVPAVAPEQEPEPADDKQARKNAEPYSVIVPGKSFGRVQAGMSRDEIATLYPDIQLIDHNVDIGEGATRPGVVVPLKDGWEFSVVFETDARQKATTIKNIGKSWQYEGVGIGSDLTALHASFGEPFTFLGFAWDYSGTVMIGSTNWKAHDGKIWIRLSPQNHDTPLYKQMVGDRVFSSNADRIESLDLAVYDVGVSFK